MGRTGFLVDPLPVFGARPGPGPAVESLPQDVGVPGMADGLPVMGCSCSQAAQLSGTAAPPGRAPVERLPRGGVIDLTHVLR